MIHQHVSNKGNVYNITMAIPDNFPDSTTVSNMFIVTEELHRVAISKLPLSNTQHLLTTQLFSPLLFIDLIILQMDFVP